MGPEVHRGTCCLSDHRSDRADCLDRACSCGHSSFSASGQSHGLYLTRAWREFITERGLDEPNLLLQFVIGVGTVALAALFLTFWDCLAPLTYHEYDAEPRALAILNPANRCAIRRLWSIARRTFFFFWYVLGLYAVSAAKKRHEQQLHRWTRVSAFMVPALTLMMWESPDRLVYHNSFQRVDLGDSRCYELGQEGGEPPALLSRHLGTSQPHRARVRTAACDRAAPLKAYSSPSDCHCRSSDASTTRKDETVKFTTRTNCPLFAGIRLTGGQQPRQAG